MYIRKQNEYDLMMISIIKQHGTFVHNYHCTFYITVVNGYMYMYVHVPTQYMYMYIVYTVHVHVHTCNMYLHSTYAQYILYMYTCIFTYTVHVYVQYIVYTLHVHVHTCRDFFWKKFQRVANQCFKKMRGVGWRLQLKYIILMYVLCEHFFSIII